MARVLITGSTTGLGEAAARRLLDEGHEVVLHARNAERAAGLADLASRPGVAGVVVGDLASRPGVAGVVVGDLAVAADVHAVADQVEAIGGIDAAIHNAATYADRARGDTPEGHPRTLAVNVLAPYVLTARTARPSRLVYLTSDMHRSGDTSLRDLGWATRRWDGVAAYCDSKLFVSTLAAALARRWPETLVNSVDPGWVPTRMGGPGAPDDLEQGHVTQAWLAVAEDAEARTTGGYWHHRTRLRPAPATEDEAFQEALLAELASLTGVPLP